MHLFRKSNNLQILFQPIVHEYCYARSNVCCPAYMKKEVQILPPAPVTTPSSFQASVSSPLFCLFPVVLVAQYGNTGCGIFKGGMQN